MHIHEEVSCGSLRVDFLTQKGDGHDDLWPKQACLESTDP